jgi:hypothetical protein
VYHLGIFYPWLRLRDRRTIPRESAGLTVIPELLSEHGVCEYIDIFMGPTLLFSVDCHGRKFNRSQRAEPKPGAPTDR